MLLPALATLLVLPLSAQADVKSKSASTGAQTNPAFQESKNQGAMPGVRANPLHQGSGKEGANPLFQEAQRHVQGILVGLKPAVAARLQGVAEELSRAQSLNGPEAQVWPAAEAATRKALGASMPGDAEGPTALVVCLWASKRGYDYYKASSALVRACNVLKTKHDTVKNAIGNVR